MHTDEHHNAYNERYNFGLSPGDTDLFLPSFHDGLKSIIGDEVTTKIYNDTLNSVSDIDGAKRYTATHASPFHNNDKFDTSRLLKYPLRDQYVGKESDKLAYQYWDTVMCLGMHAFLSYSLMARNTNAIPNHLHANFLQHITSAMRAYDKIPGMLGCRFIWLRNHFN